MNPLKALADRFRTPEQTVGVPLFTAAIACSMLAVIVACSGTTTAPPPTASPLQSSIAPAASEPIESAPVETPTVAPIHATKKPATNRDPDNPPGSRDDFIWINGYTQHGGKVVEGYWRRRKKTDPKPPTPPAPLRVESGSSDDHAGKVWVEGYTRKNGTKVKGYWRSK
jgi:hypothetical protein